ncbi:VOC family protein [Sorangium sp. So ce726]|uniref:VOC family protein n=1 Tax=Sorangium sp. So ce726 TaxID=3133319 RepID=UPI003F602E87
MKERPILPAHPHEPMIDYAAGAVAIGGVNHMTLAVRDLDRAVHFYVQVLGGKRRAQWARGATLELGTLWRCLELDAHAARQVDDSHLALFDAQLWPGAGARSGRSRASAPRPRARADVRRPLSSASR